MEAKALSFVLRAASSEHYKSSTRRVFTYVVGGRVGMNDTCYFTLDMKKLDSIPTPSLLTPTHTPTPPYSTLFHHTPPYSIPAAGHVWFCFGMFLLISGSGFYR